MSKCVCTASFCSHNPLGVLPTRKPWDHAIDLKPGFEPKKGRLIPLSHDEQKEINAFIDENLAKGFIRPSKSPQTSPVFFIPKKDGGKRMVTDYRYLNKGTVKNNYPLPLITQLVDCVKGCDMFSKMDLRWGYNNVRIKEGDEWKGTFVTARSAYEPLVMFFGMCNSPGTFQQMMNDIFAEYQITFLIIYMDDLLTCTKRIPCEKHMECVRKVLQKFREHALFLKVFKCMFCKDQVEFLGMTVSGKGISMSEDKLKAISD